MNKLRPSERWIRLAAFFLSLLLYAAGVVGVYRWSENLLKKDPVLISMKAVNLSFAQMELMAAEETPPPPEILPPPEEVDVALEEIIKEPEPEPVRAEALVNQEAAAPEAAVDADALLVWIQEQIEREKYYPAAAERMGISGTFELLITMGADGMIRSAEVLPGKGHGILRQALERMMRKIVGRRFGRPLGAAQEFPFQFEFE
ncbi:MAG: TonB family protein [Verrucomicrobia bacterium]|nr:TonB family protein [Verrucomicrobiota bacterium]